MIISYHSPYLEDLKSMQYMSHTEFLCFLHLFLVNQKIKKKIEFDKKTFTSIVTLSSVLRNIDSYLSFSNIKRPPQLCELVWPVYAST